MGYQDWFRIIENIILCNLYGVQKESLFFEEVNYEAINVYFSNGKKLYCLNIEFSSGIHVYLKYHQGYLKTGNKNFIPEEKINKAIISDIRKIKLKTIFNYDLRMKKLIALICEKINVLS